MSQRTNEELLERHEAGLSVYKSDERRLSRLIAAAYANKRSRELEASLSTPDHSEVQVSYDLAREDSNLATVTVSRVFENGFKVLLHLQGDDAVAFIDAWNARPATLTLHEGGKP